MGDRFMLGIEGGAGGHPILDGQSQEPVVAPLPDTFGILTPGCAPPLQGGRQPRYRRLGAASQSDVPTGRPLMDIAGW